MARVTFVKKARKDYPESGIKKGDSYYWWKFRFGGKHKSKVKPKPSQLTQSEFLGTLYAIQEEIAEKTTADFNSSEDFDTFIEDKKGELNNLADETNDKRENMPENLYDSPTGEMLEERSSSVNEMADELENIDTEIDIEKEEDQTEDEYQEEIENRKQEILDEIQGIEYTGE